MSAPKPRTQTVPLSEIRITWGVLEKREITGPALAKILAVLEEVYDGNWAEYTRPGAAEDALYRLETLQRRLNIEVRTNGQRTGLSRTGYPEWELLTDVLRELTARAFADQHAEHRVLKHGVVKIAPHGGRR